MFNIKLSKILLLGLCLCGALGFSQANITVSKTHPRYFEKNGATWIPISTNYLPIQNFEEAEKYFKHFAENGGNAMRIWVSTDFLEIEDQKEGKYNPEKLARIEQLLQLAEKYHIYITGSNAFLLSNDLATLFTGRTFSIEVFPFSFKEYVAYFNLKDLNEAFELYTLQGGMAGSFLYDTVEEKYKYISEVFETLIIRDIQQKYRIKNTSLLDRLDDFLLDNISSEVSARSIANTFAANGNKVDDKTISSYLKYLCASFAFYKILRYDIKGKKYLTSQDKYYPADHSFKYAKLGTKNFDYGRIYENIICIELLRRGYEVYTGVLYKKEIDFVAIKRDEKIYIQVSDDIFKIETIRRETTPLLSIKDAYPKIIIARTRHAAYQYEGIMIYDIADWLFKTY